MVSSTRSLSMALLCALLLRCGGGSGPGTPAPGPSGPVGVAVAALSLPVPAVVTDSNGTYAPPPYSGTRTVTFTRPPGFTGALDLAVDPAQVPAGVKADFADPVLGPDASTAELTIQAGYPDPADPTFATQIYPSLQACSIPITASAPGLAASTGYLALDLVAEPADFALGFLGGTALTNLDLLPGVPLQVPLWAYVTRGSYPFPAGPVTLGTQDLPAGVQASFDSPTVRLNETGHSVTFSSTGSAAQTQAFLLTASFQGVTRTLPVVVTTSPAPFYVRPPSSPVSLAPGQSLGFPLYLWHDDDYFGTEEETDPPYVPGTALAASAPPGLTASFDAPNPDGLAVTGLTLAASPGAVPGTTQTVTVTATRTGGGHPGTVSFPVSVRITDPGAPASTWIQAVEWGQTVVAPDLRLVGGKPALLRVLLLADRAGVASPPVRASITGAGVPADPLPPLLGPDTVNPAIGEGDLPVAGFKSASSYTLIVPGGYIQPGMQVAIDAGPAGTLTLAPPVDPGTVLDLVLVPIVHQGVAPTLPADPATLPTALTASWPLQGVRLSTRAPYTTATVIPLPTVSRYSGSGWGQLLNELASLRLVDGSAANYYGMVNLGVPERFASTRIITGISQVGVGVGLGIDEQTAGRLGAFNPQPSLDLAIGTAVHEVGHGFGLYHAPAGGAAGPQLDFPYKGASIGAWGYDPVAQAAHDPTREFDVMSYQPAARWTSDWNYRSAQGYLLEKAHAADAGVPALAQAAGPEQWVVSGWIGPDGRAHLAPLIRAACAAAPPVPGPYRLRLAAAAGTRVVRFRADPVPDLPAGERTFTFTVPAAGELIRAEVAGAAGTCRRTPALGLAARSSALAAAARDGSLVAREGQGVLHLEWDVQVHPYLNVLHEGSRRTTLALHLAGGVADLPLAGLPEGGRFVLHYSDGLNSVVRTLERKRLEPGGQP